MEHPRKQKSRRLTEASQNSIKSGIALPITSPGKKAYIWTNKNQSNQVSGMALPITSPGKKAYQYIWTNKNQSSQV